MPIIVRLLLLLLLLNTAMKRADISSLLFTPCVCVCVCAGPPTMTYRWQAVEW